MNKAHLRTVSREYLKAPALLILIAAFYLSGHPVVYAQSINSIIYELYYSPIENIGLLIVNIVVGAEDCDLYYVYVNIFGENGVYEFQYYDTSDGLIVAGLEYKDGSAEFLACGHGVISLYYTLGNIVEESSLTAYELQINTSTYRHSDIPVEARVYLDGEYRIVVSRVEDTVVNVDEENESITVSGHGVVIISLLMEIEEPVITETFPTPSTTTPFTTPVSTSTSTTISSTPTETPITSYPSTTEIYSTRVTPNTTTTNVSASTSTIPHSGYTSISIEHSAAIPVIILSLLVVITVLIVLITKRKQ